MAELFAYPCEQSDDCLEFLESGAVMTFEEFCTKHCAKCSDRIMLDIPYVKEEVE